MGLEVGMNIKRAKPPEPRRRAASGVLILVLPLVLGAVVLAADVGYVVLIRSQLQVAADSSVAGAAAKLGMSHRHVVREAHKGAMRHAVPGRQVQVDDADVEMGRWDADRRTFIPSSMRGNAVRVTARRSETNADTRLPLAVRWFNSMFFDMSASAVAVTSPRDIVFVVDLSGSMNDDSEPCRASDSRRNTATAAGETPLLDGPRMPRSMRMQQLFDDFGFGSYPGELESIGRFAGVPDHRHTYAELTKSGGPMTENRIPKRYRIHDEDDELDRKRKCYSALIDLRIAQIMPAAKPAPDSQVNYEYWEKYLDYVICPDKVVNERRRGKRSAGGPSVNRGRLPPRQDHDRIGSFGNSPRCGRETTPQHRQESTPQHRGPEDWHNRIGYLTYLQFVLDFGRDLKPDGRRYVPLSRYSPDCPWHEEMTAGGTFQFPPRTQPMHSVRRALIAALATIARRNAGMLDSGQADRVSIVTFDSLTGGGPLVEQPLTADYRRAMRTCARLQAVGDRGPSRATSSGLEAARRHLSAKQEGGRGRWASEKVVVLITGGLPDVYSVDPSEIDGYIRHHPTGDFYQDSAYALNAPLMLAAKMRADRWQVFSVGVGPKSDADFLDRMARCAATADASGHGAPISADPGRHQRQLTLIFQEIVSSPRIRIVQ